MPIVLLILCALGLAGCAAKQLPEVQRPRPIVAGASRPVQGRASSASSVIPKSPKPAEPIIKFHDGHDEGEECPGGICRPPGK